MKLPFSGKIPAHYYSDSLTQLERFFSERDSEGMISIKLRPISKWPISTNSEFVNAYMYPAEYEEVSSYLVDKKLISSTEYGVTVCKVGGKDEFLVVEHETGAEIVVTLAVITASLSLAKEVISLIKVIIEVIDKKNEQKKRDAESRERFYGAEAISIEQRTKNGAEIVLVVPLPTDARALDLKPIQQALTVGKQKTKSQRKPK